METSLAKKVSEIGFRGGKSIIKYSENPEHLRVILSEGLFQALSLFSDVKEESVALMMSGILEDYQYEPVDVITEAIKDIASGRRKIYGRVTPNDIREVIQDKLEKVAEQRERDHEEKKKEAYIPRGKQTSLRDYIKGEKRK